MKVQKIKNPFVFWLPAGTCCKNLAILISISNVVNEAYFFDKNHLNVTKSYFSSSKMPKSLLRY
jgi:hypothetical protein